MRWIENIPSENRFRQLVNFKGQHFFLWEDFCTTRQPWGLGYSAEAIDAIISERRSLEARSVQVSPVARHGGDRKSDEHQPNAVRMNYGNNADYRIALLKRDHKEIAARLEAGEFKTVAEAERAAGITKPKRVDVEATPAADRSPPPVSSARQGESVCSSLVVHHTSSEPVRSRLRWLSERIS